MRLAIVSDTHMPKGSRALPGRRASSGCAPRTRSCTPATSWRPRCCEAFERFGPPLHAVYGNVDAPELQERLPAVRAVDVEGVRIVMVHDAGPSEGRLERLRSHFKDADAVVFGHSHLPLLEERDGFAIFNPGSPTERRRAPRHTMGHADVDDGRIRFELIDLD